VLSAGSGFVDLVEDRGHPAGPFGVADAFIRTRRIAEAA
jgi:hypothetical protein